MKDCYTNPVYMKAIAAGLFGTLLMTGALYLLTAITGKNYKVIGVLATMVTNRLHHRIRV